MQNLTDTIHFSIFSLSHFPLIFVRYLYKKLYKYDVLKVCSFFFFFYKAFNLKLKVCIYELNVYKAVNLKIKVHEFHGNRGQNR